MAPTPSNWNAKVPTSNPSSWLVEVLTSDTHPLSAIDISELDLESFAELYNYCEDNELEVNMVLMDSKPKQQVIESILSLCNSVLFRNLQGKIQVVPWLVSCTQNRVNISRLSFPAKRGTELCWKPITATATRPATSHYPSTS